MSGSFEVKVASDHLQKEAKCSAFEALCELVWNSLDADAKKVHVHLHGNKMGGISEIQVEDDGHGLPLDDLEATFGSLGGSIKKHKMHSPEGRRYHGQEGKGRYKAFAIGSRIKWTSTFSSNGKDDLHRFEVAVNATNLKRWKHTDLEDVTGAAPGMIVTVDNASQKANSLLHQSVPGKLTVRFAPFLKAYGDVKIFVNGMALDPASQLSSSRAYSLENDAGSLGISGNVELFEWNSEGHYNLFACTERGVVLDELPGAARFSGESYSAYVQNENLAESFHDGRLPLAELDEDLAPILRRIKEIVTIHFRHKQAKSARATIRELKERKLYPFEGEPASISEEVTRQVFDICTIKIHEFLPRFRASEEKEKGLLLRLVKDALGRDPKSVTTILGEIFKLTAEEQEEFAELLSRASLSAVISASKTVAERLQFLVGLTHLITDRKLKKKVKERKHLQKILEGELWIFGENYSFLSPGGGDVTLRRVLKDHLKRLGRTDLTPSIKGDELGDIPDFCLYRKFISNNPDEYDMLVAEIKRPAQKLNDDHLAQVRRYAKDVALDKRFPKEKTQWTFIVVSTDVTEAVEFEREKSGRNRGLILEQQNLKIFVRTWHEIVQEAKGRMEFFRRELEYQVKSDEEGLEYIRKTYSEYLPEEESGDQEEGPSGENE